MPLQTSITIDNLDFEDFTVQDQLHIGISVKDFKAIVTHAETLQTSITAIYNFPSRPMQLSYNEHGMQCEFTLMTIGDYRGASETPAPAVVRHTSPASATHRPSRQSPAQVTSIQKPTSMPPPTEPASRSFTRESQSQRTQRPSLLDSFVDHEIQVSELNDMRKASASSSRLEPYPAWPEDPDSRIAPTQRISDVCLLNSNAFAEVLIPHQITTLFGD